jgi:hypothetical protein
LILSDILDKSTAITFVLALLDTQKHILRQKVLKRI